MANRKPLTDAEGEVRELTARDAAHAVPFDALPESEKKILLSLRRRGPQKAPKKVPISIRLSHDVAERLRASGDGWQRRADEILRAWLELEAAKSEARPGKPPRTAPRAAPARRAAPRTPKGEPKPPRS